VRTSSKKSSGGAKKSGGRAKHDGTPKSLPARRAPDATKQAILDVAETLFAENGIAATSLRSILLATGVNVAAAHYHFGSKEALIEEVVQRRALGLVKARDEQLRRALEIPDRQARLRAILRAFFEPAFLGGGESRDVAYRFAQVRSHLSIENNEFSKKIFAKYFNPNGRRFVEALLSTCPHVGRNGVQWRFHLMLGAVNYSILNPSRIHILTRGQCNPMDVEVTVDHLVEIFAMTFAPMV
jgi:AcrR family transcriptional regulator